MREVNPIRAEFIQTFPPVDEATVSNTLDKELHKLERKIVVLDDDPTGVQTVHGISVYTDWIVDSFKKGFSEKNCMFFVLTNSRAFSEEKTICVHKEIAKNILEASRYTGKDFILISRSDSTLRGHYPIETEVLRTELERNAGMKFDGEIIFPFFKEGGRFTIDNIHYVKEGDKLVPAGMTEFARDKSFGYQSSDLRDWCEEKTKGLYLAKNVIYITLDELRNIDYSSIENKLLGVSGFNKIIVNAVDYIDVKIFISTYIRAINKGKRFIFRSAAAVPKVLGGIPDKGLLRKAELITGQNSNGGIVLVGSHVNKTTLQLEELKNCKHPIEFIEFNQHLVLDKIGLLKEVDRVVAKVEQIIKEGRTVVVYTKRERFDLETDNKEKQLACSVEISDAVTSIIGRLSSRPNFIIAKGGITSSDVGTKALHVKRATVMGQIKPGIPVWRTDQNSKFPNMPYVIFPGNVGEISTLRECVEILTS